MGKYEVYVPPIGTESIARYNAVELDNEPGYDNVPNEGEASAPPNDDEASTPV